MENTNQLAMCVLFTVIPNEKQEKIIEVEIFNTNNKRKGKARF